MYNSTSLTLESILAEVGSVVVSRRPTRLRGEILHVISPTLGELFIKSGQQQERNELLREYRSLTTFSRIRSVATAPIIAFQDNGNQAALITRSVAGEPLHKVLGDLGRDYSLSIIAATLKALWNAPSELLNDLPIAANEEIHDIRKLVIDKHAFQKATDSDPEELLIKIASEIALHDHNVISHGDLCLPNILVGSDLQPVLIDWGKSGKGHPSRDMASLQVSLDRNLDSYAFFELADRVGFDWKAEAHRLHIYRMLDFYWYHSQEASVSGSS